MVETGAKGFGRMRVFYTDKGETCVFVGTLQSFCIGYAGNEAFVGISVKETHDDIPFECDTARRPV